MAVPLDLLQIGKPDIEAEPDPEPTDGKERDGLTKVAERRNLKCVVQESLRTESRSHRRELAAAPHHSGPPEGFRQLGPPARTAKGDHPKVLTQVLPVPHHSPPRKPHSGPHRGPSTWRFLFRHAVVRVYQVRPSRPNKASPYRMHCLSNRFSSCALTHRSEAPAPR